MKKSKWYGMKKILAMVTVCVLTIVVLPIDSIAGVAEESKNITVEDTVSENALEQYLKEHGITNGTVSSKDAEGMDIVVGSEKKNAAVNEVARSYPAKYDPRGEGKVPALRSQVGGTCWLFATMSAVESNLIHKGLTNSDIDLSELQTVYFLKYPHVDPLGYYSDKTGDTAKGDTLSEFMDGGDVARAIGVMSAWAAPVYEEDAPFFVNGDRPDYDTVDSWVLDENLTDKNYWHFKGSKTCRYNVDDVKYLIQNYGGVTAAYYQHATYYIGLETGSEGTYHYPYSVPGVNHAVEIVGWDDNYPKENFYSQPDKNGAWLCKNSYGNAPIASNNVKTNGYFWMSYYEDFVTDIYAIEMDSADTYENIYAHEGCELTILASDKMSYWLSLYEAKAYPDGCGEIVDGVMTYLAADTSYEVTVYVNPDIRDGKLIGWSTKSDTICGKSDYLGYYTIDMGENPVYVSAGDTYAICILTDNKRIGGGRSVVNEEGICYSGDSLDELTDRYTTQGKFLCLRGLTNKAGTVCNTETVSLSATKIALSGNETYQLTAECSPADVTFPGVTFYSTDDTVASVDENGNVSAKGMGDCQIVAVSYDGNASAVCDVHVACDTYFLNDATLYTGETATITPVFQDGFLGGSSELFEWSVDDESIATIDESGVLTAHAPGIVTVTSYLKENPQVTASCSVTVIRKAEQIRFVTDAAERLDITVGEHYELCVEVLPEDVTSKSVVFEIEDDINNVFSVKDNVLSASDKGSAVVVARTTDGSNLSAKLDVYAYSPVSDMVPIEPEQTTVELKKGDKYTLRFRVIYGCCEYLRILKAASSNAGVAKVVKGPYDVPNGGMTALDIEVVGYGTADITIVSEDLCRKSLTYHIVVKEPEKKEELKNGCLTKDGVIYRFEGNSWTIVGAEGDKKTYFTYSFIPYNNKRYYVKKVAKNAFKGHKKLVSISIPSTVEKIESGAFYGCGKLKSLYISSAKVSQIGDKAFYNCKSLEKVGLPSRLTKIGKSAFQNCKKLKDITIPKNVTQIGSKAFYNCTNLKKITIVSKKIKSIGSSAFKKVGKKASIKVPKANYKKYLKLLKGKYRSGTKIKK